MPVESAATRRWILAATILGSTMAFIDTTVVNIALPVMQRSLRLGVDDAQWIVDSYMLVLSALILAGGSLGDRLGRARVFLAGIVVFAIASLWCGLAPGASQLIAARALQGLGAALLVPGSLALISEHFPADTRGRAIGTWSSLTSVGILAGPLLGGFLVQTLSWRAVFAINVPIALVVIWIVWRHVPTSRIDARGSIDWLGSILITLALGGIVLAVIKAPALGWHAPLIVISAMTGVVALVAFFFVERRVAEPIVPLSLFRSRNFSGANLLTLLLYAGLSGATFFLPFNFIQIQHYSPAQAGAAFLPFVATMSLLSRWTGALADRMGPRLPLTIGPLVAATGFALLALPRIGGSYWTTFFPGILTLGIGMAITVAPLTTTVMTAIRDERYAGAASGINNAVARAAGLLAIAMFGAIAVLLFARNLDRRLERAAIPATVRASMQAQANRLAEAEPPASVDAETRGRIVLAAHEAFVDMFRLEVMIAAALAAASGLAAAFIIRRPAAEAGTAD